MTKVSIIIPVYNVEKYIRKALDSICEQTLEDIECICIDDCSTDRSKEIVQEYVSKDCRFKLISLTENQSQGFARNIGIKEATGEFLMFLDPDDWYTNNACEIAYNHITSHKSDIANFNYYKYLEETDKLSLNNYSKTIRPYASACWKHIYKSNYIKENNIEFAKGKNCEDSPFYVKAMISTDKISIINTPLYYYRKRKDRSSCRNSFSTSVELLKAKDSCYEILKNASNIAPEWSLTYCINTTLDNFNFYGKNLINKELKKNFYNKTRKLFTKIYNEDFYNKYLSEDIRQKEFKRIVKYNYYQYFAIDFFEKFLYKFTN